MKRYWWLVYVLIFSPLALSQQVKSQQVMPALALTESSIGYATVQEAFEALSADLGATQNEYEGWTIFQQKVDGKTVIWSFTHEDHPVHPSVVRREVVKKGAEVSITMGVLCHSSRLDSDQLIEQFNHINQNLKRKLADDVSS